MGPSFMSLLKLLLIAAILYLDETIQTLWERQVNGSLINCSFFLIVTTLH